MKLPENPGYGTICRTPFGTLWVRTGHDKDYPWSPVRTRTEGASDEYVRKQGWEVVWSPDEPGAPEPAHRLVIDRGVVAMTGTRVTSTDPDTGDTETVVIENDYVVICDGNKYVDGVTTYPRAGTTVITIKTRKD